MKRKILAVLLAVALVVAMLPMSTLSVSYASSNDNDTVTDTTAAQTDSEDESCTDIGEAASADDEYEDESVINEYEGESASCGFDIESDSSLDDTLLTAEAPLLTATSGTIDSISWSISNGTLTISGSGAIPDYSSSSYAPWYDNSASVTSIVIGEGITSIGAQAFYNMSKVTSVSLPGSVTSIGKAAFNKCESLTGITLPQNVTSLSRAVFAGCLKLSSINLDNITSVADYALQETILGSVSFSAKLTSLSGLAFYGATITGYTVASGNSTYKSIGGVIYSADGSTLVCYPTASAATSFTVPSSVTAIGDHAFIYNNSLTSLNLGSVTKLGESACQHMSKLTSISIPNSVTEVGYFTFYECTALKSVTFGSGLSKTSYEMFERCSKLTNICWNTALTELNARTFAYCASLANVVLPANIKTIGNGTFGECYKLASFESKGLSVIPYQAFINCTSLTSLTLNEGVTSINRAAFYGCSKLTSVTLPASVSFVHSIAFSTTTAITCLDSTMRHYGKNGYRHLDDVSVTGTASYSKAFEVLELVNKQRVENGLSELHMDATLLAAAMQRAAEQSVLFAHTRPDSSTCYTVASTMFEENIAYGYSSAESVMDGWMNSSGHKANILSSSATTIGIGCFIHNGVTYWVQCFGAGSSTGNCSQPSDTTLKATISIATEKFTESEDSTSVVFGSADSYEYSFSLVLDSSTISGGSTTQATMKIANGDGSGKKAVLDADCVNWSTGNSSVASVNSAGVVTGISKGSTTVNASLGHYSAQTTVNVGNSGSSGVSMYRLYNPNSGEHFYTADSNERDYLIRLGWSYEGIGWTAPSSSSTPVYRLYNANGGEHHYTSNAAEKNLLEAYGWSYEGIGWYSDDSKSVAVYRQYNPNAFANNHNYTTSLSENNWLVSLGWKAEGIGWYGME